MCRIGSSRYTVFDSPNTPLKLVDNPPTKVLSIYGIVRAENGCIESVRAVGAMFRIVAAEVMDGS